MNEKNDTINLRPGETYDVQLKSRGAMGLSLDFKITPKELVTVARLENADSLNSKPGDAVIALFRITAARPGSCTVVFFETKPWIKEFTPIVQRQVTVVIVAAR